MRLLALSALLLSTACGQEITGVVTGTASDNATVLLLWPDDGLGRVGGIGDVNKNRFTITAKQPDNQHTGLEFGVLVLFDGEPSMGDVIGADEIGEVLGAAPRHYIVDSNATCSGVNCRTDDHFDRGMTCGACELDGSCAPVGCGKVELVVSDSPLGLPWVPPEVQPVEGVFIEDGSTVAVIDEPTVLAFPPGGIGGSVFRDDDPIERLNGVHLGAERVSVQIEDAFGVMRGIVRKLNGAPVVDFREEGNALRHGPILSPDGSHAASVLNDGTVVVHELAGGTELLRQTVAGALQAHWSVAGDVVYAMPDVGGMPTGLAVLPGAVPADFPECLDGAPSPTADPCDAQGRGASVGWALAHPVLLEADCAGTRFADAPRNPTAVAVRTCAPTATP